MSNQRVTGKCRVVTEKRKVNKGILNIKSESDGEM